MHNNRTTHARRFCLWLVALLGVALLSGCDPVKITNLTSSSLPVNPSQTYTFSARIIAKSSGLVAASVDPRIVIDGKNFPLTPSPIGQDIYEFDYAITPDRTEVAYYFLVTYVVTTDQGRFTREAYTGLQRASLASRYVLSLEANRGPVGARIGVLGRGFTPQDIVYVGGQPARTLFESANSVSFFVPALAPARAYEIVIGGASGTKSVGTFRVDGVSLSVAPTALNLRPGERQTLLFTLPNPAPAGGLLLDVTTDVPESVIMPEVIVPAGSDTLAVTVEGGLAGTGSLFLRGFGVGEITIPVSVR